MAAGAVLSFDRHTETVETALASEDLTPLVRSVFDAVAASFTTNTTKQALLARAPQATPAMDAIQEDEALQESGELAGRRASDRLKAIRKEAATPVISALEKVVEHRSTELSQICRGNAEEIVASLQELQAMRRTTEYLRENFTEGDAALKKAGSHYLNGLEQLQDLRRVQSAVAASCRAVGSTKQLLQLCTQAGRAVNGNELFKAFKLLERAEKEFLSDAPMAEGSEAASRRLKSEVRLHSFLTARVQEMRTAIQSKALKDFNDWLVKVREQARPLGLQVLRRAAWSRHRAESLLEQRRKLAMQLPQVTDPEVAAAALAKPLSVRSAGQATLDPASHPAASALLSQGPLDVQADILAGIDMTQLHRCLQMHSCLGKLSAFKEYYQINRRLQLNNDLAAQGNFVSQYHDYLAQLVGFFVIEDRVGRAAEALSGSQVDAGWETAVTYLKLAMETAFDTLDSATSMLAIKDLMLLVCSALGQCGYHVAPLLDVLMNLRSRYHRLLNAAMQPEIVRAVEGMRAPCVVKSADQAAELSASLGLPLSIAPAGAIRPTPPFQAPFSEMVPELIRIVRRYVKDSATYVWGLVSAGEVLAVVRLQRDSMLLQLPVRELERVQKGFPASEPLALDRALQSIADLSALTTSLHALDDFTFTAVRGGQARDKAAPQGGASESGRLPSNQTSMPLSIATADSVSSSGVTQSLPMSQITTYTAALTEKLVDLEAAADMELQRVLTEQLRNVLKKTPPLEWQPDEPVKTAKAHSQYVLNLLDYIKEALKKVSDHLPVVSYQAIGKKLMELVGQLLMSLLLSEELQAYNLYALFRLNHDARSLADFASKSDIPRLEEGLDEVIQFCDLMVTGRLEEILDSSKRATRYPAVDLRNLLILLRKYREVVGKSEHSHALGLLRPKQPESFLKKRTAERVAKQIRAQLWEAGIPNLPK